MATEWVLLIKTNVVTMVIGIGKIGHPSIFSTYFTERNTYPPHSFQCVTSLIAVVWSKVEKWERADDVAGGVGEWG